MTITRRSMMATLLAGAGASLVPARFLRAQGTPGTAATWEWTTYGADLKSTRYAPLDQINADNFADLEVAWRFKTDALGPRPEFNFQTTPLMVGGVVYSTAGSRRAVVALDAATGELLWMHREDEGARGAAAPRQLSGRGLAYWSDGRDARIVYVTPGYHLVALDARTGVPVAGFGTGGVVDLKLDNDQTTDPETGELGLHAAPIIARHVVIVGAAHLSGSAPKSRTNEKGYVRAYDVRTGRRLWTFHTIPGPGEFGHDTWENDSWRYTGNAGVWAQMSVDEELGLVYMPTELPTGDYYGGHRPGDTLFGECLVAVELETGRLRWYFQLVHHGIWDHDIPCAPVLADIQVDGRTVKAVAQATKQGWVYVFDRETGQPVWPIEERPVEQSDVPGEQSSATQPFVTRPPAFERQGVSVDDLIDFTPELRAEAVQIASRYKMGPLFTPPVVSRPEGPLGILMLPSITGGANWQGGSLDPETGTFYIYSVTNISALGLVPPAPGESDMAFIRGTAQPAAGVATGAAAAGEGAGPAGSDLTVRGLPLVKPPYGRITAIDLNRGELVWQIAHGETPDNIRNHPALRGLTIPRTGRPGRIGVLTTKTLVIAGEGGFFTTPAGVRGAMLRAYDKRTGDEVGAVFMPAPQTGSPMTYVHDGQQYLLVAISGGAYSGELLAFRLPTG
ncbi:MAG: pyrroloquinoline quinone-dependent dehydrogenase [Vicinamibacterales bacterium]